MGRVFTPAAPDTLWVADMTYVSTWSGWVYVAFVVDAFARRILGWRAGTSMSTQLVLDALEQAVWTRQRTGSDLSSVVAHTDHGSQYTSIRYTEHLAQAGIAASVGTTGDSYDNALAETINGLYKTELIKPRGPWRTVDQVEIATAEWVDWSTSGGSTGTAATSHPPNSRPPTTLKTEPSPPLSSQTARSPDMSGRFTSTRLISTERPCQHATAPFCCAPPPNSKDKAQSVRSTARI